MGKFATGLVFGAMVTGGVFWWGYPWTASHHPRLAALWDRLTGSASPVLASGQGQQQPPATGQIQQLAPGSGQGTVTISANSPVTVIPPHPVCPSGPANPIYSPTSFTEVYGIGYGGFAQYIASGVLVSPQYILLANHEIRGGYRAWWVKINPKTKVDAYIPGLFGPYGWFGTTKPGWVQATLVWQDPQQDMAILELPAGYDPAAERNASPIPLANPSCLANGEATTAIGERLTKTNLGLSDLLYINETANGTITSLNTQFNEKGNPQVHATGIEVEDNATPGFSGGPVLNPYGQLIGITVAGYGYPNGAPDPNYTTLYPSFVVPASYAFPFLRSHGVQVPG